MRAMTLLLVYHNYHFSDRLLVGVSIPSVEPPRTTCSTACATHGVTSETDGHSSVAFDRSTPAKGLTYRARLNQGVVP